jgi:hypothetical protein
MSRAQEGQVATTAGNQNQQFNQNAQSAFTGANNSINEQQGDIGDYQAQLSQFAAANPYGQGGAFQTAENQSTANTADAASQAEAQKEQGAAVRGGLNATAGVAAGDAAEQANTRNLMQTQAQQNASRIKSGAGYGQQVLSASQVPATLQGAVTGEQSKLAGEEAGAGNEALGIDQKASDQPSFWDSLGNSFAGSFGQAGGQAAVGAIKAAAGCWIAAELYGGWDDPRTIDVRKWLFGPFRSSWYGYILTDLYTWRGEWMAAQIKRHPVLRKLFLPIFNAALAKAREGSSGR